MQAWLGFLFVSAALSALACSGVQTGDGGDDGPGCDFREEPVTDLTTIPAGFERSPEEILRPATDGLSGVLTMADGRQQPVDVAFSVDAAFGKAVYRLETPGIDDCKAEGVTVLAVMTIDGGPLIMATKNVEIRTLGAQFWIAGGGGQIQTTESPTFESQTLEEPALLLPLQRDLDGTWRGDWRWSARVSCEGKQMCIGIEEAPFGTFVAD